MPRRELRNGTQVAEWLEQLGSTIRTPGEMILIGSGGLLWHYDWAKRIGLVTGHQIPEL
jgi:hypothetical protein